MLATFIFIETSFPRLLITSNAVETLGGVVDKVLTTDLMRQAKECLNLLQFGQRIVDKLVTVDHMKLVLGEKLKRKKCKNVSTKKFSIESEHAHLYPP